MTDKGKAASKYYMLELPPLRGSEQPTITSCGPGTVNFLSDTSREDLHQLRFLGSTHHRAQNTVSV